jgi:O-acetyl-ADP-ribose deacetylase
MPPKITLCRGDITEQRVDAIVNAANSSLMGGGGVDGAIHRTGGPEILEQCREIVRRQGRCPTGQAVITTGGKLPARYVVHTVGPVWQGGSDNEDALLGEAYANSMQLAFSKGVKTIAFPSISTGAYRFPLSRAAGIALRAVSEQLNVTPFDEVRFVLFSQNDLEIYKQTYDEIFSKK